MEKQKILLVDDDGRIRNLLKIYLEKAGFQVSEAENGLEALLSLQNSQPDLIVLDIMMPGDDGLVLCRDIRAGKHKATPVLMLTARNDETDRIIGLEMGADDYLVKPFSFAELLARVRTILRRGRSGTEATSLQVADLVLDLLRRRVARGGKRIDLTAKEFGLLELLMRRKGEVLPRSLIASQVWDMNFDSDTNVIEVAVRRLRAKIDDGFESKLIQTVRGMGYVLEESAGA